MGASETVDVEGRIRVRLTETEHRLLLGLPFLAPVVEELLYRAEVRRGLVEVSLQSYDLDELTGCVDFEADHAGDEKLERQLRRLLCRLNDVAGRVTVQEHRR